MRIFQWEWFRRAIEIPNSRTSNLEAFYNGMEENYGVFLVLGGMFTNYVFTYVLPYVAVSLTLFILLVVTAVVCRDDLGVVAESLHYVILLFSTAAAISSAQIYKQNIINIMTAIGGTFFDYGDSNDPSTDEKSKNMRAGVKNRKAMYSKAFIFLISWVGLNLSVIRPFIEWYVGNWVETENNVNTKQAVLVWYPFKVDSVWEIAALNGLITYEILITVFIVLGEDVVFLCIGEELCTELEILCMTMEKVVQRARSVYEKRRRHHCINEENDPEFRDCLKYVVSMSVKHHLKLISIFDDLKTYMYMMLLVLMSGGAMLVCMSAMVFVSDEIATMVKILFMFFLSSELVHILLFCWYGERLSTLSKDVGDKLYGSDWLKHFKTLKVYILIVQIRSAVPLALSVGGYASASMETYSNVLSSSYSYFNLLRAAKE